jgi:hypothetical protein
MERYLGRQLRPDEVVHHRNGTKHDNRIVNLELMTPVDHAKHHHTKIIVSIGGLDMSWMEACATVGVNRSNVRRLRVRRGLTHQAALDHYLREGKRRC